MLSVSHVSLYHAVTLLVCLIHLSEQSVGVAQTLCRKQTYFLLPPHWERANFLQ